MIRLFLASHYLRRHRIIWVSVVGVVLGIGAIVVVDSIFNGFIHEYLRILQGLRADVVVRMDVDGPGRRADPAEVRRRIEDEPGVVSVVPRLLQPCLFPTEKELPPALGIGQVSLGPVLDVHGVVFEEEHALHTFVAEAELAPSPSPDRPFAAVTKFLTDDAPRAPPILLGQGLVEHLGLELGDRITLLTLVEAVEGRRTAVEPISGEFVFVGAVNTGQYQSDLHDAWVRLEDLQRFAKWERGAHEFAVELAPGHDPEQMRRRLRERLFGLVSAPSGVSTWRDGSEAVIANVEDQRQVLDVMLFFLVVVAGFTLLVTLNMTIHRKRRDIGLLSSLGAGPVTTASIFTGLGLLVCGIGTAVGVALGSLLAVNVGTLHEKFAEITGKELFTERVYGLSEVPHRLDPERIVFYVILAFVSTLSFSLLASWRAARTDPIVALRKS